MYKRDQSPDVKIRVAAPTQWLWLPELSWQFGINLRATSRIFSRLWGPPTSAPPMPPCASPPGVFLLGVSFLICNSRNYDLSLSLLLQSKLLGRAGVVRSPHTQAAG